MSANKAFTRPGVCDSCSTCSFLLLPLACRPCGTSTSGAWTWSTSEASTPGTKATRCGTRTPESVVEAAGASEAQAAGQLTRLFGGEPKRRPRGAYRSRAHHEPSSFTSLFSSFHVLLLIFVLPLPLHLTLPLPLPSPSHSHSHSHSHSLSRSRSVCTRPQPQESKTSQRHDSSLCFFLGDTIKSYELDFQKNLRNPMKIDFRIWLKLNMSSRRTTFHWSFSFLLFGHKTVLRTRLVKNSGTSHGH